MIFFPSYYKLGLKHRRIQIDLLLILSTISIFQNLNKDSKKNNSKKEPHKKQMYNLFLNWYIQQQMMMRSIT